MALTTKKKLLLWTGIPILSIAVLAVLGLLLALWGGYIYVGVKQPSEQAVIHQKVCSQEILDRYLTAFSSGTGVTLEDAEGIFDEIRSLDGYSTDPNCVYILIQGAIVSGNTAATREYVDAYSVLSDQGMYAQYDVARIGVTPERAVDEAELYESGAMRNAIGI